MQRLRKSFMVSLLSEFWFFYLFLSILLDGKTLGQKQIVIKEKFRYFNHHSQRITSLSWSPHSMELLASSSYDGTVQASFMIIIRIESDFVWTNYRFCESHCMILLHLFPVLDLNRRSSGKSTLVIDCIGIMHLMDG